MESPTFARRQLRSLLVGEDPEMTRRALLLAGGFVVALAALEYVFLLGPDEEVFDALWRAFVLEANLGEAMNQGTYGAALVVGLAAVHAYLNEGYLPSVALASAPIFGASLWTIGSLSGVANLYLDPASAVRRTFPEALAFATVGFLVGIGLRWLTSRFREEPGSVVAN